MNTNTNTTIHSPLNSKWTGLEKICREYFICGRRVEILSVRSGEQKNTIQKEKMWLCILRIISFAFLLIPMAMAGILCILRLRNKIKPLKPQSIQVDVRKPMKTASTPTVAPIANVVPDAVKDILLKTGHPICTQVLNDIQDLEKLIFSTTDLANNHAITKYAVFFDKSKSNSRLRSIWESVQNRIMKAAVEVCQMPASLKNIKWLTGNRSALIPIMMRAAQMKSGQVPELMPPSQLLQKGLVPLTGELSFIASEGLSGVGMKFSAIARSYASRKSFVFQPGNEIQKILKTSPQQLFNCSLLKISILRLLLTGTGKERYDEIKAHIQNNLIDKIEDRPATNSKWKEQAVLIGTEVPKEFINKLSVSEKEKLKRGQLVAYVDTRDNQSKFCIVIDGDIASNNFTICLQDGSLYNVHPKELKTLDASIIDQLSDKAGPSYPSDIILERMKPNKERLMEILALFRDTVPLEFSAEETDLIENSFPIVWASTTHTGQLLDPTSWIGCPGEIIVDRPMPLGTNIQIAFTNKKNIEKMRKLFQQFNITVLSMDALNILGIFRTLLKKSVSK